MIKRTIIINKQRNYESNDSWGSIIGVEDGGSIVYYTGQTDSNSYVCRIPLLFTNTHKDVGTFTPYVIEWKPGVTYKPDDIVSYDGLTYVCKLEHNSGYSLQIDFDNGKWVYRNKNEGSDYTVTFTGQTKISEFRRYSKKDSDSDLYNPISNTGFTYSFKGTNGLMHKIIGERDNDDDTLPYKLYDYEIYQEGFESGATLYSDINSAESKITYKTKGLNATNSGYDPILKEDYLIGISDNVKTSVDVFIDRGFNSSFDKHIRLSEVKSVVDMFNYGNGYFKIKED